MIHLALTIAAIIFIAYVTWFVVGCVLAFIMIVRHNHMMKTSPMYAASFLCRRMAERFKKTH